MMLCCSASGARPLGFRASGGRSIHACGPERLRTARRVHSRAVPDGDGQNSVGLPTQPQAFHGVENELESRLKTHRVSRWRKVEDCFVLFPPGDEPAAIVHFVGGAFVGAAPQLTYSAFLEELAAKGAVRALKALGRRVADLPIYGLGHSLGSTIHLLLASRYVVTSSGNILLSYNNNSVAHTIPLLASLLSPGSQVIGPLFVQLASLSLQPNIQSFITRLRDQSPDVIQQVSPLLDQLLGIYSEILRGARQFVPTAVEARHMVREGYCVERNLLVQFEADPVDDTEQLADVLSTGELAGLAEVRRVVLPGNHLRPLQPQLARLVPAGWAETARTQSNALMSRLLDAAGMAGISGETRGGLERLASAATYFAGAMAEALTGSNGDSDKTQTQNNDGAPAASGADISDLIDECALFMGLEEQNHDEEEDSDM